MSGGGGLRDSTALQGEPRAPCLPLASHRVAAVLLLSELIPILIKGLPQIRALRKHDLLSPFLLPLNDTVPFPVRIGCLQIQIQTHRCFPQPQCCTGHMLSLSSHPSCGTDPWTLLDPSQTPGPMWMWPGSRGTSWTQAYGGSHGAALEGSHLSSMPGCLRPHQPCASNCFMQGDVDTQC